MDLRRKVTKSDKFVKKFRKGYKPVKKSNESKKFKKQNDKFVEKN